MGSFFYILLFVTLFTSSKCVNFNGNFDGWSWSMKMDALYDLRTFVDTKKETITFTTSLNVTGKNDTKWWTGLGLSLKPEYKEGDFIIMYDNTTGCGIVDYHFLNGSLVKDDNNEPENGDWQCLPLALDKLEVFSVTRSLKWGFNTTDDMEIKQENVQLIWAYGVLNEAVDPTNSSFLDFEGNRTKKGFVEVNLRSVPFTSGASANSMTYFGLTLTTLLALMKNVL